MLVAFDSELSTFAEASAVGLDTKMDKVTEHRKTEIVRFETDFDLYKNSASSSSDRDKFSANPR